MNNSPLYPPRIETTKANIWHGLNGAAAALAICALARKNKGVTVVVCATPQQAISLEQDCKLFKESTDLPVLHFPDWETLAYDLFSPDAAIISARIRAMAELPGLHKGLLIVPVGSLLQRLPPVSYIQGRSLQLRIGQQLDPVEFRKRLAHGGYAQSDVVSQAGEFCIRGSIMDVFAGGLDKPIRIEWFDDEIESLRHFDPESQRSTERFEKINVLPSREYPFSTAAQDDFRQAFRSHFSVDTRHCPLYQDLRKGHHPPGLEFYLPLFFTETASLFDYLASDAQLIAFDDVINGAADFLDNVDARYEQRRHDIERPILPPDELYFDTQAIQQRLDTPASIWLTSDYKLEQVNGLKTNIQQISFNAPPAPQLDLNTETGVDTVLQSETGRVLIAADSAGRREVLRESLHSLGLRPKLLPSWQAFRATPDANLVIAEMPLSDGFSLPDDNIVVLTEAQLFAGRLRRQQQKRKSQRDPNSIIRNLTDLNIGAPVVHEEHGIGRYLGLNIIEVAGQAGEFLTLEYAEGDKLYVPVSDLQLITRYTGGNADQVLLHKLGTDRWAKTKRKAAKKIRDAAAELLQVYARRQAATGIPFELDKRAYTEFAAKFPYEETQDQQNAIDAAIEDMTSNKVMDRVVCGDVGFGKTEVALRAAYVAASAGYQVAVLAPTTLLVRQHYNNFSDRFADLPIRLAMLSRMRTSKETDKIVAELAEGKVDIIIGTHRLLQKSINFKNLGLVIVDEEQRFGVRQKEQLQALRAQVDLLTLTATPIPRTLGMALVGIRDLSIIATPPARRMPVKTMVSQWDDTLIRDAMQRELQRGGQIYFLHNEVQTIQAMANQLQRLLPDESIAIGHGQMPPAELDRVMREFYARKHSILLCTTIIENGIDVPSANTIIIHNADHFGLAQLHQLRGRVGRSHHRAFAYLLVPDFNTITSDAKKRLQAIAELDDLGAGFTLASHDMEIRGAGELLGEEQSGQIAQLGFELHLQLLERAVDALQNGQEPDLDEPFLRGSQVELHLPALIPNDYLPDVHARLTLYKRVSGCADFEALRQLQIEMIDRFGLLPEPTKNLFAVASIKLEAASLGFEKISFGPGGGWVDFSPEPKINTQALIKKVQYQSDEFKLQGNKRLSLKAQIEDDQKRLHYLRKLLLELRPATTQP